MHLLYADEAGTHAESRYFALAGLAVFERETYFLSKKLDEIAERYFPGRSEATEFHASLLMAQQQRLVPPFDTLDFAQRNALRNEIYRVIGESRARLFGVAIEKSAITEPPYEHALEHLVNRFDRMLQRLYQAGDQQRGVIVVAESSYRENLEALANRIWTEGHRWGETRNMADVPFFARAKTTRLLQLADFCVNAVYRRFEVGDARNLDIIARRIDQDQGNLHGLVHITKNHHACSCPACVTWRYRRGGDATGVEEEAPTYLADAPP